MTEQTDLNTIYLSLGSNVGDKFLNLKNAIEELQSIGKIWAISPIFETQPWGFSSDNTFYNAAIELHTYFSPNELLSAIENIEKKLGRTRKTHNRLYSDRIIDIDILFYNNIVFNSEELTIPHPLLQERDFVLYPLRCIAPNLLHPILNETIEMLLKKLNNTKIKQIEREIQF